MNNNGTPYGAGLDTLLPRKKTWGVMAIALSLLLSILLVPFWEVFSPSGNHLMLLLFLFAESDFFMESQGDLSRHVIVATVYIFVFGFVLLAYKVSFGFIVWISTELHKAMPGITQISALLTTVFLLVAVPIAALFLIFTGLAFLMSFTGGVFRFAEAVFDWVVAIMDSAGLVVSGIAVAVVLAGWLFCKFAHGRR